MTLTALTFALMLALDPTPAAAPKGPQLGPPPDAKAAAQLVSFATPESMKRLDRSKAKVDFFHLANHFESQQNMGYCGPASSTVVLNALRADDKTIEKPRDPALFPAEYRKNLPPGMDPVFSRYTQGTFFDDKTTS